MNADGSNPVKLTPDDGSADYIASWAPGGDRILFMNDVTGDAELFVINVDGTGPLNISNQPTFEITGAQAWGRERPDLAARLRHPTRRLGPHE
jgi:Tol biopolymer transport system component